MERWTTVLLFILMNSHLIFQGSRASQPPGYIGCYPDSIANFVNVTSTDLNNGTYCSGVCVSFGYRFAATQHDVCKCTNQPTSNVKVDEDFCDCPCPEGKTEYCGGENAVSLYDNLHDQGICLKDPNGLSALTVDGRSPDMELNGDNSATKCQSFCKQKQYRFSGTRIQMCICGDDVKINISTTCKTQCAGNASETCGGEDSVSVRYTGYERSTTEILNVSTKTDERSTTEIIHVSTQTDERSTTEILNVSTKTDERSTTEILHVSTKTGNTVNSAKGSQMTALYITLPVVVIVAGTVALTVGLVLRHKRKMEETRVENLQAQDMAITTQTIQADGRCNAEYSEYSTILDSNDTFDGNKDYDKVNDKQATSACAIYSHLPDSNTTDNAYSHIGPTSRNRMNKTDNTYNTFQFSQLTENTSAPSLVNDDKNSVYDRAITRDKSQADVTSDYDHLSTGSNSK